MRYPRIYLHDPHITINALDLASISPRSHFRAWDLQLRPALPRIYPGFWARAGC